MIISEIQSKKHICLVTAQNSKHPQILATTHHAILAKRLSLRTWESQCIAAYNFDKN